MKRLLAVLVILSIVIVSPALGTKSRRMNDQQFLNLCMTGTEREIIDAIKAGANVNAKSKAGLTPLICICTAGNASPKVVNTLIKSGADVNARSDDGLTPLIAAAEFKKSPEIISMLIDSGADVKARDKSGKNALDYARENETLKGSDVLKRLEELSM